MYFENKGPGNTAATVELALQAARQRGLRHLVVASGTGETARLFTAAEDLEIVCVTSANGFPQDGAGLMKGDTRAELEGKSIKVLTASHVLSGVERGLSSQSGGMYPAEIMSNTLRMFGQDLKVCVEISIMALDAGLIPFGQKIVAVGGTGRGADTAVIITPAQAAKVLGTRIHKIICKPA